MKNLRWVTMALFLVPVLNAGVPERTLAQDAASAVPVVAGREAEELVINVRHSVTIKSPWPFSHVSVTDPEVANVTPLSPEEALVQGKSIGMTDLFMRSEKGQVWHTRVVVQADVSRLETTMKELFPDGVLKLSQSEGVLLVQGTLARAEQASELHRFFDGVEMKYVDMTRLAGTQQVQLSVRVAEVSRRMIREMGVNWYHTGHDFFMASQIGSSVGGALNPVQIGPAAGVVAARDLPFTFNANVGVSPAVTLFGGFPTADIQYFIQSLAENQYLRLLAEPTLVAASGEDADFLAGGEYPIPVVQGTTAGATSISIEYRPFGVMLRFRPTVMGDGKIRLYVAPEVSEISDIGAVQIQGFNIPSVVTRKAQTTLEMYSGQTFAMAGLINNSTTARASKVALLGDLPILGPLFRSVRYANGETELVVLVTPTLVEPLSLDGSPPLPGMLHVPPNDWELYVDGKLEGGGPPKLSPAEATRLKELGLDKLQGPGGWTTHMTGAAESQSMIEAEPVPVVAVDPVALEEPNTDR